MQQKAQIQVLKFSSSSSSWRDEV